MKTNKTIATLLVVLMITVLGIAPRNTHAVVAGVTLNPGFALAGLTVAFLGFAAGARGTIATQNGGNRRHEEIGMQAFFGSLLIFAICLDEKNQAVKFANIDEPTAKKYGLSNSELNSYNNNKEKLTLVFNEISAKVGNSTVEEVAAMWNEYRDAFPKETYTALAKLMGFEIAQNETSQSYVNQNNRKGVQVEDSAILNTIKPQTVTADSIN